MPRVLATALAVVLLPAGLVAAPVLQVSNNPVPRPVTASVVDHDVALSPVAGRVAATSSAQGTESVGEVAAGRFTTVGLSWQSAGEQVNVQVRGRLLKGGWSSWLDVPTSSGEAETVRGRLVTPPVYVGTADRVQVKVLQGRPAGLKVTTVDPGSSAADAAPLGWQPASSARAEVPKPAIITRAQWGADESLRTYNSGCGTPEYASSLRGGILNHTAGSNDYAPSDSAAIVRAYYAYHVKANGWCDLGYNFLVDKYGQIFEGRFGGVDKPVIGAHAMGFNTGTVGISLIGNYETATPTAAAMEALAKIFAYRFSPNRLDPKAMTTFVSGGADKYPQGSTATVPTLLAHRDVNYTACPGANLYTQMDWLRNRVAQLEAQYPRQDFTLYPVTSTATGSGRTELHPMSLASGFSQFSDHIATAFPLANPSDWRFFVAPYGNDGQPDLIGVGLRNTGSGKVEVHVLSAASGYTKWLAHIATAVPAQPAGARVDVAMKPYAGDGRSNLYVILASGTGSGNVEVHVASEASSYQSFLVHAATALPQSQVGNDQWEFLVGDAAGSGDLVGVLHGGATGSGRSEVHVLSRSSGYRDWTLHAALPVGLTSDQQYNWLLDDANADGRPDLLLVKMNGTTSGRTEVSVLDSASTFQSRRDLGPSALQATLPSSWQFDGR